MTIYVNNAGTHGSARGGDRTADSVAEEPAVEAAARSKQHAARGQLDLFTFRSGPHSQPTTTRVELSATASQFPESTVGQLPCPERGP